VHQVDFRVKLFEFQRNAILWAVKAIVNWIVIKWEFVQIWITNTNWNTLMEYWWSIEIDQLGMQELIEHWYIQVDIWRATWGAAWNIYIRSIRYGGHIREKRECSILAISNRLGFELEIEVLTLHLQNPPRATNSGLRQRWVPKCHFKHNYMQTKNKRSKALWHRLFLPKQKSNRRDPIWVSE